MDYNKLVFTGNVGRDAELRFAPSGTPVLTFPVASNRTYVVNGEKKSETTWYRCAMFGKRSESLSGYIKKGGRILVEGRLSPGEDGGPKTWQNNEGVTKASFEVFVTDVTLLGGKKPEEQAEDSQL